MKNLDLITLSNRLDNILNSNLISINYLIQEYELEI